jgi:hypothetical protein
MVVVVVMEGGSASSLNMPGQTTPIWVSTTCSHKGGQGSCPIHTHSCLIALFSFSCFVFFTLMWPDAVNDSPVVVLRLLS